MDCIIAASIPSFSEPDSSLLLSKQLLCSLLLSICILVLFVKLDLLLKLCLSRSFMAMLTLDYGTSGIIEEVEHFEIHHPIEMLEILVTCD